MNKTKILVVILFAGFLAAFLLLDLGRFFDLEYVQSQLHELRAYKEENFALSAVIYFGLYVAVAALSVPGAGIATLMGGAIFGFYWGLLLASFASTLGATIAFLISRWILRDWVQRKFGIYLKAINEGMQRDGNFYLFSIRMVPLFPFFIVNLLMGLTPIKTVSFIFVSQIGMLAVTAVIINAGSELSQISSVSGLLSVPLIISVMLLGIVPLIAKSLIGGYQSRKILRPFTKPKKFDANLIVIGAGSAGLVSALIAAGARAKVILIEKHLRGGDCLHTGCVPSKSLIRSARIASYINRASSYGIDAASGSVNFARVMERVQKIIATIAPVDSAERFTSLGVECIDGEAKITSPYCVEVNGKSLTTRSIIVATGARPLIPPIPGLDEIDYLTSENIWELRELPKKLLVIGGGPIGCELAQSFSRLGASVVQVDMAPRIMPREDEEVSEAVTKKFNHEGIEVLTGHKVLRFVSRDGGQSMEAEFAGQVVTIEFDKVLLAIGRKPSVEGFGLEQLNMPLGTDGSIRVNEYLQTAYPNIYACGDVAGPYQFTHMASYQAWFASLNAMIGGIKRSKVDYSVVPWATFTDPEVARVGLNELEARSQQIDYEITRFDLSDLDRALTDEEAHGFIKILTVPGKDKILGVTIVGYHAGELIGEFVTAMTHNLGLKKIAAVTHIYPTLSEANKFAANAWRKARMPEKYFPLAEKYFDWRRK